MSGFSAMTFLAFSVLLIKKKNGVTTIESRNYTASKSDISSDNTVASEYHKNVPNSVAFFKVPLPGGKLSDCGVKRSCVRIGSIDCGPTNCIYYLTYKTFDRMTMLELEMSGKTWGWIAVGFSSDDKMGADDVIACARTNIRKNDVVVKSLWNREYVTPVVKESHYNVTYTKYENGRVSCKLTLPLESSGPKNLDLTNDWFQLYAMGNITSSGTMTKHDVAYASEQKITVIQKKDFLIISAGTTTSLVKIHLCLLFWSHRLIA